MEQDPGRCVLCERSAADWPLLPFEYRGRSWRICSQHLPVLIHDPSALTGRLPGAEGLEPAAHKD